MKRILPRSLFLIIIAGLILSVFYTSFAGLEAHVKVAHAGSFGLNSLPPPDYESGNITLAQAVAWDNPSTIIYPDDVYPSETTLNHNLGTYDIFVYVLADDGQSRYVPMPNALVGGYGHEDNWFLTSQNQIMLRNWDYNRAVPVHVMIWKLTPDYDSGWLNLPQATQGPGILPPVYPTETTLIHNLGTYDVVVFVLADDGSGKYAQVPSEAIGSYGGDNNWFLTSSNQIMLRNWDPYRTVPVHVMIWRVSPDYDSGWTNLPNAVPWDNPGTIIYPDDVTPTEILFNHNLSSYNILVNVLADDGYGRYVQIPTAAVGGGLWGEDNWFLTSQNQIMLRNWDYTRDVPVRIRIWKPSVQITFNQTGLTPDFTGTVLTVDAVSYGIVDLPVSFLWDSGSSHSFTYESPLLVASNAKQYLWTSTGGLSTLQSASFVVASSGTITGNYKTQYYLNVTSLYDLPNPTSDWFDEGTSITASVTSPWSGPTGTRYLCVGWSGTGSVPSSGVGSSTAFSLNQPSNITWNWKTQYYLTVKTDPLDIAAISGEGWYDVADSVTLTAPSIDNYTFGYWDVDGANQGNGTNPIMTTMNAPHTATAHYILSNPLIVHIQPTSATITLGQSVTFTSTIQGGTSPYAYQWYQNGNSISGATSDGWIFTPLTAGIHYILLQVKDFANNTAQSETARVVVLASTTVGGYSVSFERHMLIKPLIVNFVLVTALALFFIAYKRKTVKK